MPTPITASTLSALLSAALAQKPTRPLVLALDGRCGSGKTTLANGLAAQLPGCTLLRTDDFYLPPAQRIPDWAHTPCANMDLTRLRDEALRPAYAGQPVAYRAYSCRPVPYTHLRAHETPEQHVCRLLLEKKKKKHKNGNHQQLLPKSHHPRRTRK